MAEMIIFIRGYKINEGNQAKLVYNRSFQAASVDFKKIEEELQRVVGK